TTVGETTGGVAFVIGAPAGRWCFFSCPFGHTWWHYTCLLRESYQLEFSLYSGANNSPNILVISTTYETAGTTKLM
ncbi:MAG: hypothetical protein QMC00_05715, partial [Pseudomonadales bacterium]